MSDLRELLAEASIWNLDPGRQDAAVTKLGMAGVQPADLRALIAEARSACSSNRLASAQVARLIDSDVQTIRRAIEGSRRARAKAEADGAKLLPGEGDWATPGSHDTVEDRAARIAFCRVVSDRHLPSEVAADLGVAESEIAALVERGRLLQGAKEIG